MHLDVLIKEYLYGAALWAVIESIIRNGKRLGIEVVNLPQIYSPHMAMRFFNVDGQENCLRETFQEKSWCQGIIIKQKAERKRQNGKTG